jgi:hypothetical protein
VRTLISVALKEAPLRDPLEHGELAGTGSRFELAAGDAFAISDGSMVPLSAADIASLRAETRAIYLWGQVDYEDVFGRDRWVKFSYVYERREHQQEPALWVCSKDNEAS